MGSHFLVKSQSTKEYRVWWAVRSGTEKGSVIHALGLMDFKRGYGRGIQLSCCFVVQVHEMFSLLIVAETDRLEKLHGREDGGRPLCRVRSHADLVTARLRGE